MADIALQKSEMPLIDIRRYVKRLKFTSQMGYTGLISVLAVLPSVLLSRNTVAGTYGTVLALIALLAIALRYDKMRKLALSAAVLPLSLMVMAVYPYNPNSFYRTWVEHDVMLLLALMYTYLFKEKRAKKYRIKMKQLPQVLPIMIVIGEVLGVVGFSLLRHQYGFTGVSLLLLVPMVIVFAITEEMLFRGLIQRQAMKLTNKTFAVVLTIAVYAAASIGMGSMLPLAFGIISAAVLGAIYANRQNLLLTATANIAMKLTYVGLIAVFVLR